MATEEYRDATEYRDQTQDYLFDSDGLCEHIQTLCDKNKLGEAKTLVEKALELSPNNTELLQQMGFILFGMDRTLQSREMFQRARDIGDQCADIDYFLGETYFFMDEFDEAKRYYDVYVQKLEEEWRMSGKPEKELLKRVSEIANSFYDNDRPIEAMRYFRFVFKNAVPMWMDTNDYLRAADCLHRLKAFPDEKYGFMDNAIMFSNGHINMIREKYACMLYDDGSFEENEQKQKEYANRAIEMFEAVGIRKIKSVANIKRLQLLYKYNRNWNNRTRKRMKQCKKRIEELEQKKKGLRFGKGKFKTARKKDKRKRF